MPTVKYAHLCDYALLSNDGKPSALGMFGVINVPSFPAAHARSYLVFEIEFQMGELKDPHVVRIDFVDEDGSELFRLEKSQTYRVEPKIVWPVIAPEIVALPPLPLKQAGRYAFNIFVDGVLRQSISISVVQVTSPA